jgi:hypothetical protein
MEQKIKMTFNFENNEDKNQDRKIDYETDIENELITKEYMDLENLDYVKDPDQSNKLAHELTNIINSYDNLSAHDKVCILKNITLVGLRHSVKGFLKYKSEQEKTKFQEDMK